MTDKLSNDEYVFNEIDAPLPEYTERPFVYRLHVVPVAPRKVSSGGIILPETARDAEYFMNALCRVVKIGHGCFAPRAWANYEGIPEEDRPQVASNSLSNSRTLKLSHSQTLKLLNSRTLSKLSNLLNVSLS